MEKIYAELVNNPLSTVSRRFQKLTKAFSRRPELVDEQRLFDWRFRVSEEDVPAGAVSVVSGQR